MQHIFMLTPDQIKVVRRSLKASLKFADSDYIAEVDTILNVFRNFPDQ